MQKSHAKPAQTTIPNDYQFFIKMGQAGHYPLFFNDWLHASLIQTQNMTFRKASHNVKHVFNQLARHKSVEKKKTALLGMDKLTREEFIRSFFKIIEHEMLKENNTLQ